MLSQRVWDNTSTHKKAIESTLGEASPGDGMYRPNHGEASRSGFKCKKRYSISKTWNKGNILESRIWKNPREDTCHYVPVNKLGRLSVCPQELLTAQFGLTKGWLISSGFLSQMCHGTKIRCFSKIQYHIRHKYKTTDACLTGLETNLPYHARQTSQHAERKNGIHIHTIFQKRKTGKKIDSQKQIESTISQHKTQFYWSGRPMWPAICLASASSHLVDSDGFWKPCHERSSNSIWFCTWFF